MKTFVVSTASSFYMAKLISDRLKIPILPVERKTFEGGERYTRFDLKSRSQLLNATVIVVASTATDEDLMEVYRMGCELAGYGTCRRIFAIPFLGYSTMERAVKPGEVVAAKTVAKQLSNIPNTGMGNTFMLLDLHVSGLVSYFEGDCAAFQLYGEPILGPAVEEIGLQNFVVGTADLGRPYWAKAYAKRFKTGLVLVDKDRDGEKSEVVNVIGDVSGKAVMVYDDMLRSCNTIVNAAEAYLDHGATEVHVFASHAAFTGDKAIHRLLDSPVKTVTVTNSHWQSNNPLVTSKKIRINVVDVSGIYADSIREYL